MAPELQPTGMMTEAPTVDGPTDAMDTDLLCQSDEASEPPWDDYVSPPTDPELDKYRHHPPDPDAAETIAKAKRPCLKSTKERNPAWDAWHSDEGVPITVESCEDLVQHMTWKGHWALVLGETYRTVTIGPARTYVMEFVVPRNGNCLASYNKEIKLAGYTHWSRCSRNGWEPFALPADARGWGKEVTDPERLADWYAERLFSIPMPHPAGDGWVCRAQHYSKQLYPFANEHGPHGDTGLPWNASQ